MQIGAHVLYTFGVREARARRPAPIDQVLVSLGAVSLLAEDSPSVLRDLREDQRALFSSETSLFIVFRRAQLRVEIGKNELDLILPLGAVALVVSLSIALPTVCWHVLVLNKRGAGVCA